MTSSLTMDGRAVRDCLSPFPVISRVTGKSSGGMSIRCGALQYKYEEFLSRDPVNIYFYCAFLH